MSPEGRAWLIRSEGFRRTAYLDTRGYWTIGVGHKIEPGEDYLRSATLTNEQVEELLTKDLERFEQAVNDTGSRVPLTQQQFDALVHFAFNIGASAFRSSTLAQRLRAGEGPERLRQAWMMWTANAELVPRRRKEWMHFAKGYTTAAVVGGFIAASLFMLAAAWSS